MDSVPFLRSTSPSPFPNPQTDFFSALEAVKSDEDSNLNQETVYPSAGEQDVSQGVQIAEPLFLNHGQDTSNGHSFDGSQPEFSWDVLTHPFPFGTGQEYHFNIQAACPSSNVTSGQPYQPLDPSLDVQSGQNETWNQKWPTQNTPEELQARVAVQTHPDPLHSIYSIVGQNSSAAGHPYYIDRLLTEHSAETNDVDNVALPNNCGMIPYDARSNVVPLPQTHNHDLAHAQDLPVATSSVLYAPRTRKKKYAAEPPKADSSRTWIRTNSNTKGNTRTGKTNNFRHGDYAEFTPHPIRDGKWTSPETGVEFTYNQCGELEDRCLKADRLHDFIRNHPLHLNGGNHSAGHLIIWIQKHPADSARRTGHRCGLKCRIDECPCQLYNERTIMPGHYQLAFDEQWTAYGVDEQWKGFRRQRNPLHVAGVAHLYCVERFMDLAELCRRYDVRADDRVIENEPNGVWSGALSHGTGEVDAVNNFIEYARFKTCSHGEERDIDFSLWTQYPVHAHYRCGDIPKPHERTLTCRMFRIKTKSTGPSKMRMMKARKQTGAQFFNNLGDLVIQVKAQRKEALDRLNKRKAANKPPRQTKKTVPYRPKRATGPEAHNRGPKHKSHTQPRKRMKQDSDGLASTQLTQDYLAYS